MAKKKYDKIERINQSQYPLIGSNIRRLRKEQNLKAVDIIAKLQLQGILITTGTFSKIEKRIPSISRDSSQAIDGARTRGLDLGKVARYQLRHYRKYSLLLYWTFYILHEAKYFVNCFFKKIIKY